jgi:hypothetical protein
LPFEVFRRSTVVGEPGSLVGLSRVRRETTRLHSISDLSARRIGAMDRPSLTGSRERRGSGAPGIIWMPTTGCCARQAIAYTWRQWVHLAAVLGGSGIAWPKAEQWARPALERTSGRAMCARAGRGTPAPLRYGTPSPTGLLLLRESTRSRSDVRALLDTAYRDLAQPAIVPLRDGGIQLEWHRGGIDLEIAFSDEDPGVYLVDHQSNESIEEPLGEAASILLRLKPRLGV